MKRYPCIGGPLDSVMVTNDQMRSDQIAQHDILNWKAGDVIHKGGIYGRHGKDYFAFNRADSRRSVPTMIWLHRSLLDL